MPFFSKNITDLTTGDLAELLAEAAVENVRLEFKSAFPGPDETLKKLSGFANTFGGYLIVGASASSSDGRLVAYPVSPTRARCTGEKRSSRYCHNFLKIPSFPTHSQRRRRGRGRLPPGREGSKHISCCRKIPDIF